MKGFNYEQYLEKQRHERKDKIIGYIILAILLISYLACNIHYDRTHPAPPYLTFEEAGEQWESHYWDGDPR